MKEGSRGKVSGVLVRERIVNMHLLVLRKLVAEGVLHVLEALYEGKRLANGMYNG